MEVLNIAHRVKCSICGEYFDRDKEPFVKTSSTRYAHQQCSMSKEEIQTQEQKDKEALERYIMTLFNTPYVEPRVQKQITKYINEYNYTYSGMLKALKYFYEVKGNSIDKANGGIGILPYIYKNAYNYWYEVWLAQQKNSEKIIKQYVPQIKEITIPIPQIKVKKRKLFDFLDKEE